MNDLNAARDAAIKAARGVLDAAKADGRELTDDEQSTVESELSKVKEYDKQIKGRALADSVRSLGTGDDAETDGGEAQAKSLGEHFVKSVGAEGLARVKSNSGLSLSAPEFKANTSPFVTTGATWTPYLTTFDRSIVHGYRPAPAIANLLGSGTLAGNAVTYLVEGAVEGAFASVAEGGAKPQIHFADPTTRTDALKKLAAFFDTSDEMVEDLDFMQSEINQRGLYLLSMTEDAQLLSGDGTGSNLLGLLNRSGIQTVAQAVAPDNAQETLFRAITAVQTATGLTADGIVINPADYQALRLAKDGNGQYFGGGFFQAPYGEAAAEGGAQGYFQPIWGLRTIVSPSVPAKTAVVGAFQAAATVYRKGGVRVESTNSDAGKFTSNIITTRIEERVALAVRLPAAIVKVTLL